MDVFVMLGAWVSVVFWGDGNAKGMGMKRGWTVHGKSVNVRVVGVERGAGGW